MWVKTYQNLRLAECQKSISKCTLMTKCVFSRGFLLLRMDSLTRQQVQYLIENACRFAAHKLTEMESKAQKLSRFGLSLYFN